MLLMYRNCICILILYSTMLVKLFILSSRCFENFLWFSTYKIMSSAPKDSFHFFLFNLQIFKFCCLIALSRTSSTMLNSSGESRNFSLLSDLKEFCLSSLSNMLAVGSLQIFLTKLRKFPFYSHLANGVLLWIGIGFYQNAFLHLLKQLWIFSPCSIRLV